MEATVRHESPIGIQLINVVLKAGQRTEQLHPGMDNRKERRDSGGRNPDGTREPGANPLADLREREKNPRTASQSKGSRGFLIFAAQAFS